MHGSCRCRNFEVIWQIVDFSLVPRACQCTYCVSKSAAYVSKSGTKFEVTIHNETLHRVVQHGSNSAFFHECAHCNELVFVTAEIEDELYGVLNAYCLQNKLGFATPVETVFDTQTAAQKRQRWRLNWCHPVVVTIIPNAL